jgi:alkanesulfonate monooxygenase SsuD/methylene tetrahydromethanopterin reductase-like flavin-dependent oxidoreductase (luciferase family)
MRDKIGAERGWPPMSRADFEREIEHGSLYVGSPETVARKIVGTVKAFNLSRFTMKYSAGPLPHEKAMRCIELYGRRVMPLVREMVG